MADNKFSEELNLAPVSGDTSGSGNPAGPAGPTPQSDPVGFRAQKAMELVNQQMDAWVNSGQFTTDAAREWAQRQANETRQAFATHIAADAVTNAGQLAAQNYTTMVNSYDSLVTADPSKLDYALKQIDSSTEQTIASNASMSPEQAGKFREEAPITKGKLAFSAIVATAGNNVDQARSLLSDSRYSEFINEQQRQTLGNYIDRVQKDNDEQAKVAAAAQQKQLKLDAGNTFTQIKDAMMNPQGIFTATPQAIQTARLAALKYGAVDPSGSMAFLNFVDEVTRRSISGENKQSDPRTWATLNAARNNGTLTDTMVDQAFPNLSNRDYSVAREWSHDVKDQATNDPGKQLLGKSREQFFTMAKAQFGNTDPLGGFMGPGKEAQAQAFYNFQQYAESREQAMKNSGKTASDIENTLYNPSSKDYIGNAIPHFAATTKIGAQHLASGLIAPPEVKAFAPEVAPSAAPSGSALNSVDNAWLKSYRAAHGGH